MKFLYFKKAHLFVNYGPKDIRIDFFFQRLVCIFDDFLLFFFKPKMMHKVHISIFFVLHTWNFVFASSLLLLNCYGLDLSDWLCMVLVFIGSFPVTLYVEIALESLKFTRTH